MKIRIAPQGRFLRRPCRRYCCDGFVPCCDSRQVDLLLFHVPRRLLKTQSQGLIHIVAELGWPTEYPGAASSVTTTLYA